MLSRETLNKEKKKKSMKNSLQPKPNTTAQLSGNKSDNNGLTSDDHDDVEKMRKISRSKEKAR